VYPKVFFFFFFYYHFTTRSIYSTSPPTIHLHLPVSPDRHLQRIRNVPSPLRSAIHRACVCLRFAPRHHHLWLSFP
jgi:hypothetical protein